MPIETAASKEKKELVDRVSNSSTFQRSPRLREFLLYVAECTINEQLEGVREQQIAANVFNRKPDYNPGQDNIVRVEARSLRKRLETYFATDGKDEPIVISMPKGSYSICFEPRIPEPEPEQAGPPLDISEPPKTENLRHSRRFDWRPGIFWVVLGVVAAVIGARWQSRVPEKAGARSPSALTLPFSALIDPTKDTYLVTSDISLVLVQDLRQRQISLDDYITGRYLEDTSGGGSDPAKQSFIRTLLKRRYTNAAETGIAGKIIGRNSWASQRLFLRSGHGVQLSDFKNNNVILFGSPTSNPWTRLFDEKLNFQFDWDPKRRGMFRNRSPRPGEQPVYSMTSNSGETGSAYAVVAFVPNVNGGGHVLLVSGTTAEGTEAAGEFITDEKRAAAALKGIGIDPAGPPRYFEILLEARTIAGSATQSAILASRVISDAR
jgi:hypothetical protein